MKHKRVKTRLLSLLTLLAILIPMLAMTVYAKSSEQVSFGFLYNGTAGTKWRSGTKTDIGESTQYAAGVTVNNGDFGAGSVRFWIADSDYVTVTNTRTTSSTGTLSLTYYASLLAQMPSAAVYLGGAATATVQAAAGYFQP